MSRPLPATHSDGGTPLREMIPLACDVHPDVELEVICRKCDRGHAHHDAPRIRNPGDIGTVFMSSADVTAEGVDMRQKILFAPAEQARRGRPRTAKAHVSTGKIATLNTRALVLACLEGQKAAKLPALGVAAVAQRLGDTSHKASSRIGMMLLTLEREGLVRKILPPGGLRGAVYEAVA